MLDREALNKGKEWQRKLYEGQTLFISQEELKQFIDIAVYAIAQLVEVND